MIYHNNLKILFIELAEQDERVQRDRLGVMSPKVIAESGEKLKKFYILEKKYHSMKIEVNDHTRVKNNLVIKENLSHVTDAINLKKKIKEKKYHSMKTKIGMKDLTEKKNDLKIIGNLSQAIEAINLKIKILKKKIKMVLKIKNQDLVKILNFLNEKKKQLNVLIKEINLSRKKNNFIF